MFQRNSYCSSCGGFHDTQSTGVCRSAPATAFIPAGVVPEVGDRIWYRKRGEGMVHMAWVRSIRPRLLEVRLDAPGTYAFRTDRGGIWLDRLEIELLDREPHPGPVYL